MSWCFRRTPSWTTTPGALQCHCDMAQYCKGTGSTVPLSSGVARGEAVYRRSIPRSRVIICFLCSLLLFAGFPGSLPSLCRG